MSEVLLALIVGLVILVTMVALGKLIGKRAGASPRGRTARAHGWIYEGFDQWSCEVPGLYQWNARQNLVDSEGSDPLIEFVVGMQKNAACELRIVPIKSERVAELSATRTLQRVATGSATFDASYAVFSDAPNEARDVFTDDLAQRWIAWPQPRPTTMTIDLHRQSLQVQIPYRGFQNDADAEYFLLFGEQLVKNVTA